MDFIEQLKHQARTEMLDSIVASLQGYPHSGGDVRVMAEVERLIQNGALISKPLPETPVDKVAVHLIHGKGTKNYEVYENPDMDFRTQEIKVRMWIPRSEFETDVPGVVPSEITVEVLGNTTSEALNESW